MTAAFDYGTAFSRNIGWVSEDEQHTLSTKRVAIAGMGGVGGFHLLTLARLGIQHFHIADLDIFELANFNRQAGASLGNLGRHKAEAMAERVLEINSEATITVFPSGVTQDNLSEFFTGVDLYVDGLDFFAFAAREMVFAHCHERRIPATTVAPLGMSAALLNFLPGHLSFEDYFQLAAVPNWKKPCASWLGWPPPCCIAITWWTRPASISKRARGRPPSWPANSAPASPPARRSRFCLGAAKSGPRRTASSSTATATSWPTPGGRAAIATPSIA